MLDSIKYSNFNNYQISFQAKNKKAVVLIQNLRESLLMISKKSNKQSEDKKFSIALNEYKIFKEKVERALQDGVIDSDQAGQILVNKSAYILSLLKKSKQKNNACIDKAYSMQKRVKFDEYRGVDSKESKVAIKKDEDNNFVSKIYLSFKNKIFKLAHK